jgi:WD40 repeat protein
MDKSGQPRVFISYSHDSEVHADRVRILADRLIGNGLYCVLDQYEPHPPEGWPQWMDRQLDEADFVLVVCTEGYFHKAKAGRHSSSGRGVKFESVLILNELYDAGMWNETFIPVLFEELPVALILRPLRAYARYRVDLEQGYEDLLRQLTNQPRHTRPLAGAIPILAPQQSRRDALLSTPSGVTSVPNLPPHYLPRPEDIEALKAKLLEPGAKPVGITSPRHAVGVQGMGGIGKSVLAAAVAAHPEVAAAFSGGVFWIVVGQQPDLVRIQFELALAAGAKGPVLESRHQGKLLLSQLFADRAALLVLDDVWDLVAAESLYVVGSQGRLLVTTRDAEILVGLGASELRIDVLPPDQALVLLAGWVGQDVRELPPKAAQVARECGYLPLALAMIGAMVRLRPDGWSDALDRLERADLAKLRRNFPDYPYPDLLRAIAVSVEALEPTERERYLELAVFPEDSTIPAAVLETLWGYAGISRADARDLAAKLVARSLAQQERGERLRLHDLQSDYLRHEVVDLVPLHARVVEAYAARCPEGWARGPDDGYFFQNLPRHLTGAGRLADLRDLLVAFPWIEAKLLAAGINALLGDYEAFRDDRELRLLQGALRLAAHVLVVHPEELVGQLHGRLFGRTEPGLAALLVAARKMQLHPWLRPLALALTPPGGYLVRIFTGHKDGVRALAVLSSELVVSASQDGTLKVWDVPSGRDVLTLEGHTDWVNAVAVLPGGRLVSASDDRTLRIWDIESGRTIKKLEGHRNAVKALAVVPDELLVSASEDHTLRLWEVDSGKTLQVFEGHSDKVNGVVALPDGRVVTASKDLTLKMWDITSGRVLQTLEGHSLGVNAVAPLSGGRIVSASDNLALRIWDLKSGKTIKTLERHELGVNSVAVLPDERIVSGSDDNTIRVWASSSGNTLHILEGHADSVRAVVALPDSRILSGGDDGTVRLWDVGLTENLEPREGHTGPVSAVEVLPDGRVVSGAYDSTLRVWNAISCRPLQILEGRWSWINGLGVMPDGRIVTASTNSNLEVWDSTSGAVVQSLEGHRDRVYAVAVLAPNRVLSASADATIRLWNLVSGKTIQVLEGHSKWVSTLAVLSDGRVVSGSGDSTLRVWDPLSGRILATLEGHRNAIQAVTVLSDERVVSASFDQTLRVWDVRSGRCLRTLEGHSGSIDFVATLPGGLVVSASRDFTLRLWNAESGESLHTLAGHTDEVSDLVVLPTGEVVSCSHDGTLRVWDVSSGHAVARFTFDAPPRRLAVLPEDGRIVVGDELGHLHFLSLEQVGALP